MHYRDQNMDKLVAETVENTVILQKEQEQKSRPIFTTLLEDIFIERSRSAMLPPTLPIEQVACAKQASVWEEKPLDAEMKPCEELVPASTTTSASSSPL